MSIDYVVKGPGPLGPRDWVIIDGVKYVPRDVIIEECARVAELYPAINEVQRRLVAAAIRALKEER